jgi:hypothetical protein
MRSMRANGRQVLVVFVVALALGAVEAASASASEFVFSKTGALAGVSTTTPIFGTDIGKFACKAAKTTGTVTVLKSATQKVTVQYENCTAFGLPLKASPAEYELNTNGTAKLFKAFQFTGPSCTMTFPPRSLSGLTYKNASGKLEVAAAVKNMVSFGTGGICTYPESEGTLEGKSLIELVGGTVEVK